MGRRIWASELEEGGKRVVVQSLSHILLFANPWTAECQEKRIFRGRRINGRRWRGLRFEVSFRCEFRLLLLPAMYCNLGQVAFYSFWVSLALSVKYYCEEKWDCICRNALLTVKFILFFFFQLVFTKFISTLVPNMASTSYLKNS